MDVRGEAIDYIVKKLEKLILEPESLVEKDLSQFSLRIKKQEEKLEKIIERIKNIESKIVKDEEKGSFSWF